LREIALEEFIHEENVRESKEVDELTSYKHAVRTAH
jgi:flagellar biosynthesis chaperone FliJ